MPAEPWKVEVEEDQIRTPVCVGFGGGNGHLQTLDAIASYLQLNIRFQLFKSFLEQTDITRIVFDKQNLNCSS